jgi:hypothetical protein
MTVAQHLRLWGLDIPGLFMFVLFAPADTGTDVIDVDGYPVEDWWVDSNTEGESHGDADGRTVIPATMDAIHGDDRPDDVADASDHQPNQPAFAA